MSGDKSGHTSRVRAAAPASLRLTPMSHVLAAVAWPYANGPRHIGHVSGFGVPSDVFSRYMRMAGHDVLMVSGTDEHGTPIQVQADAEGVTPRELADRYNRVIVEDLHGLGLSYDLFTRTTTAQPLRGRAGAVQRAAPQRLHRRARPRWARSRRRPAARCPTATSRAPARSAGTTAPAATSATTAATSSTRSDLINPRSQDQRRDAGVRRDRALLPRPAGLRRGARQLAGHPRRLAAQRAEVLPQPARRPPAAGDHPRPRLGRADPAGRLARPHRQADLRLVRRGHRLPVGLDRVGPPLRRPRGLAQVVVRRRRGQGRASATTSWARTTSSSTR